MNFNDWDMQDRINEILCMTHNLEYDPNLF